MRIETNGHNLTVVFADLQVDSVEAGLAPFVVPDEDSTDAESRQ
ncbi:hypothetical protein ABZV58_26320 [Nocardia sp. NPDC004654]